MLPVKSNERNFRDKMKSLMEFKYYEEGDEKSFLLESFSHNFFHATEGSNVSRMEMK